LYLLQHPTTEKLYVPVTQRQMVRTLDMFEEHQKLLEQLGTQPEASAQRRKLQMGGLLSDMAAFKYANNHAAFADFIRWYSPHDWLPEQKQLTTRMAAPDCEWQVAWESTEPCRADQQELMFDPSTEGEKALAWLEALEPWTFADDLCQIAATHAVCIFLRTEGSAAQVPVVSSLLQRATHGCKNWAVKGVTHEVCDVLANAELLCSRATSLLYCFPGSHALVDSLLSSKAGKLTTKQERASVTTLFSTDDHDPDSDSQAPGLDGEEERKYSLPTPELREYTVLSTLPQASQPEQTAVVPAFYNRVYASISSSEFRYASCWQPYQP
jgi:hypothetical protein